MSTPLIPTILCGGAGSRLWPVSRELHPKPFIRLADGQSLLQKTFMRGALLPGVHEILTVTNRELLFKTEDEYAPVNTAKISTSFILEPLGKNTAAAIATAACEVARVHGNDAIMLVMPADHLIMHGNAFVRAVDEAVQLALDGMLVTFGIKPDRPETGYGYIEAEDYSVIRFVEKPDLETAKEYVNSGRFLWNSGMFCFTAAAILSELERHSPVILSSVKYALEQARIARGADFIQVELDASSFSQVPEQSIDCAIFEKSDKVAVVPCDLGWSDIGSWNALGALVTSDEQGNSVEGEALLHDVDNCYVRTHDRLVGAVGVKNLFIIDTPDALLVADKSRAQDVKNIYTQLKAEDHEVHRLHKTVHRPWGTYTVLEEGPQFKIKRIVVKPGASLSLQMHFHRSEHWIVVSGMARVTKDTEIMLVSKNESTFIPAGYKHRLENPGLMDLVMIEVQSGEYLGEDDILRFEDNYGRITETVTEGL